LHNGGDGEKKKIVVVDVVVVVVWSLRNSRAPMNCTHFG
jgi:hypothetical protein